LIAWFGWLRLPLFCFGELNYHHRSGFFSTQLATTLPPLLHVAAANYLSLESDCRYNQSTSHLAPNFSIQVAMGSIKIIYRRISKKQQEKENDKNDYPSLPPLILIC